ncbi:MAG: hypothetical protein MUF64_19085 [Polyangiaceae bacterium]|jgi:hypothetical protein|nr:hypothetical protein [Polyangiaceae bacterium]
MTLRPPDGPEGSPDDLDPPPSAEERLAAEALARSLELGSPHPDRPLVEALQAAYRPAPIDPARHEELLVQALAEARPPGRLLAFPQRRWALLGAVAAAACLLLVGRSMRRPVPVALAASRSTQSLFQEQFPRQGGHSQRIDRIALARSRELRENRFAGWGVR